jgi:hypothetical protein
MLVACAARLTSAVVLAAVTTLGLGAAGCAPAAVSLSAEAEPPGTSFAKTRDRWSRSGRIISTRDMETSLLVSATLRSRSYQRAYSDRYAKLYRISDPEERARIEAAALSDARSLTFWVRAATYSPRWNDLRAEAGKWRLVLIDDEGREVVAERVELISTADQPRQLELLDESRDPYGKLWLVRFPAMLGDQPVPRPTARKIILRVTGPLGQTDLTWALY